MNLCVTTYDVVAIEVLAEAEQLAQLEITFLDR
jgi:hypothetical protein